MHTLLHRSILRLLVLLVIYQPNFFLHRFPAISLRSDLSTGCCHTNFFWAFLLAPTVEHELDKFGHLIVTNAGKERNRELSSKRKGEEKG
ncbi:hypothetical protein BGZ63DRAFT_384416 [Mariannaea sp. PMI_226]|nr:hypothetical protein BGZ63DRAFT_384416 [Mariannaea sp. PMI_226]